MSIPTDLITSKQAAAALGLHVSTVYRLRDAGRLRGYRIAGSRYRFSRADVEALVEEVPTEEPVTTSREDEAAAAAAVERMRRAGHRV